MNPPSQSERSGGVGFLDAHNHLQDERWAGRWEEIVAVTRSEGVDRMVVNGACEEDWPVVEDLARRFPEVIPSFGYHPWYLGERSPEWEQTLVRYLDRIPGAGVGEIGLDRWMIENPQHWRGYRDPQHPFAGDPPGIDLQEELFLEQMRMAADRNRPASIHCLRAFGRLRDLLASGPRPAVGFLLHSYGGPVEMVPELVRLGAYFGFPGSHLEERKERQREVFRKIPEDRLLVETDAPDQLLPEKCRRHSIPGGAGRILNHPANLPEVYIGLSDLRGVSLSDLKRQVADNFNRLFGPR